jgi:hypothetical protein
VYLLGCFAAFCFKHGGSRFPFASKQTSVSSVAVHRGTVTWLMKAYVHFLGSRFLIIGSKSLCSLKHVVIDTSKIYFLVR